MCDGDNIQLKLCLISLRSCGCFRNRVPNRKYL